MGCLVGSIYALFDEFSSFFLHFNSFFDCHIINILGDSVNLEFSNI